MSPKRKDKSLPPRVTFKHGSYYFLKPDNGKTKWIRLGKTRPDMLRALADLDDAGNTFKSVIAKYKLDVEFTSLAEVTQVQYTNHLNRIERSFGAMAPDAIRPKQIKKYHKAVGKASGPFQANRELSIIKRVCSYAVGEELMMRNPAREVERFPEEARKRYITDEEFLAVRAAARPDIARLMDLAYVTGQRRCDLLRLQWSAVNDKGLLVTQSKTGARLLFESSPQLRKALTDCKRLAKDCESIFIICREDGSPLTEGAFKKPWKQARVDAGVASYQFRDIRGKAGSESGGEQLGHTSDKVLDKHYRNRLPKKVNPTV